MSESNVTPSIDSGYCARLSPVPDALPASQRSSGLPWPREHQAITGWGGAQAARRPTYGADRQLHGTRRVEGHHTLGAQRVHLLGRGCEATGDPSATNSPHPRGTGRRPAPTLLLAWMQAPRAHRQVIALGAGVVILCPTMIFVGTRRNYPLTLWAPASSAVSTASAVTSLLTKTGQQGRNGTQTGGGGGGPP